MAGYATAGLAAAAIAAGCGDFERGGPSRFAAPDSDADNGAVTAATDFAGTVLPALEDRCARCHGPGSATPPVLTGDPDADYEAVLAFVEPGRPETSPLLIEALGGNGHGGGAILARGDADYAVVADWIAAGAPRAVTAGTDT